MSSYRARGSNPPSGQPPPLPPGPPPMYVFSAATSPTSAVHSERDHAAEFTFRNNDGTTPTFPTQEQITRSHRADGQSRHSRHRNREERRRDGHGARGRGGYSRGRVRGAHQRPLMVIRREATPEQFAGMGEGHDGKFVALDDISDSDEQDMEFDSSSEKEFVAGQRPDIQTKTDGPEGAEQTASGIGEPPQKKYARSINGVPLVDNASLPKWSNPDPYTVLPPTEEIQRKKKDVVKLIRKARLLPKKGEADNSIIGNDDFISFNFDDEEKQQSGSESSHSHSGSEAVAGAPTGPRSSRVERFSHREHFRQHHALSSASSLAGGMPAFPSLPLPPMSGTSNHLLPVRPIPPAQLSRDQSLPLQQGNAPTLGVPVAIWPPPDTAAALGNRKRMHDDRIKGESSQDLSGGRGKPPLPDGTIVPKWTPRPDSNIMPWCGEVDHSRTENFGFWLHKEICDFYEYIRPQDFEQVIRTELVEQLRNTVRTKWPDSDILSFGSFAAGLYLPNSDMDLVMVSNSYMKDGRARFHTKNHLHDFRHFIVDRSISMPGSVEVVAKAKVPLVKFVDRRTGLKVDVSFENDSGLHAVRTFHLWKATFPAMPIIVSLIKHFLAMRGLNEVFTGGLGGFSVTCLVVSLLQNMPQMASGNFLAEHHLGEVLMEFFDLYGNLLNLSTTAIRVDRPGYIEKRMLPNAPYQSLEKQNRLCIIDPHNPDNDLTGGSKNIHTIRNCFSRAYDTLQRKMATLRKLDFKQRKGQNLLGELFAGNYENFDDQRERLRAAFMRRDNRSPTPELEISNLALENGSKENGLPPQAETRGDAKPSRSKRKAERGGNTESETARHSKKKSKSARRELMAARNRASDFKRQFPMVEGVPTELSKKERKHLLDTWKPKIPVEGRQEKGKDTAKKQVAFDWNELKAKALSTAGGIVLAPRADRSSENLNIRRARTTKPLVRATRSDPIEVD